MCAIIGNERGRLEKRPFWMPALVGIEPASPCFELFTTEVEQFKLDNFFPDDTNIFFGISLVGLERTVN